MQLFTYNYDCHCIIQRTLTNVETYLFIIIQAVYYFDLYLIIVFHLLIFYTFLSTKLRVLPEVNVFMYATVSSSIKRLYLFTECVSTHVPSLDVRSLPHQPCSKQVRPTNILDYTTSIYISKISMKLYLFESFQQQNQH